MNITTLTAEHGKAAVDRLLAHFSPVAFGRNHVLQAVGQPASGLWLIRKGTVRHFVESTDHAYPDGINSWFGLPGTFCAANPALWKGGNSPYTIAGLSAGTALHLAADKALELLPTEPLLGAIHAAMLASDTAAKAFRTKTMNKMPPADRLVWLEDTHPDFLGIIPMRHLASFIGLAPEDLSRLRSNSTSLDLM